MSVNDPMLDGTPLSQPKCARCGHRAKGINNETGTTFWGFVRNEVTTTTERAVRILATSYRYKPHQLLVTDEQKPLCEDCWGLFVGRFLQGRAIDPKEAQR